MVFFIIYSKKMNRFTHQKKPRIAVIGAGLSGLTVAFRLKEKGFDAQVYEARHRVGGRVLTVNVTGYPSELGGENILNGKDAAHTLALIDQLHLKVDAEKRPFNIEYWENGEQNNFTDFLRQSPFPSTIKSRLEEIASRSKNMLEVLLELFPNRGLAFNVCSALLSGYEGAPPEHLSVFYIETLYHVLMGGLSSAHPHISVEETIYDRMSVTGGNSLLAEKLADQLEGCIHLDHALAEVAKDNAGAYLICFRNGRKIIADILILSMPCPVYRDVFMTEDAMPSAIKRGIESVQYAPPAKILVPVLPIHSGYKQYTNGNLFAFLNNSEHVANIYYIGEQGRFDEEKMQAMFQRDIAFISKIYTVDPDLHPVLSNDQPFSFYEDPVGHSWSNDPFAKGAYSYINAGQEALFTSMIEIEGEKVKTLFAPIDRTLFFAGEHTSILLDLGGTIEAAVESGDRTARLVEKCLVYKMCKI